MGILNVMCARYRPSDFAVQPTVDVRIKGNTHVWTVWPRRYVKDSVHVFHKTRTTVYKKKIS